MRVALLRLLPVCFSACLLGFGPLLSGCSSGTTITHHPGPEAGACLATGADCTSTPDGCCSGICVSPLEPGEPSLCAVRCTAASDCTSNCCATLSSSSDMVCEPRGFCDSTCVTPGNACTSNLDCCASEACVDTGGGSTCASTCTTGTDCTSGCCAPFNNSSLSVCSAAQFCTK